MTPKIETSLGIDAGSSSLGSAWVDFKEKAVYPKVTIFTAGVHPAKHPKEGFSTNHARREFRSKRRQIRRKKERRLKLRKLLTQHKLLPKTEAGLKKIFGPNKGINSEHWNPWTLRKKGIERKLTKYEFGRVK